MNKKRIHRETYKRFWDILPSTFTKYFIFQKRKYTSLFSLHLIYNLKTAYVIGSLRNDDPLNQYYISTPKNFLDRPLITPQNCLVSSDFVHNGPDCIPTTVVQPYPHLSKVFDHTPNNKAIKMNNTFASQHYSYKEHLLLTAQSAVFIANDQYRHNVNATSQSVSYAQVTSSAKINENNSKIEHVNAQSTEFLKTFHLINQIEE